MLPVRSITPRLNPTLAIFILQWLVTSSIGMSEKLTLIRKWNSFRWNKLNGVYSVFSVGTDEHGQKIIRAANSQGHDHPQNMVDQISEEYKDAFDKFNITMHSSK